MRITLKIVMSFLISMFLVSCVQGTSTAISGTPSIEQPSEILVRNGDLVERLLQIQFSYDYCLSAIPGDISLTFGQVLSEKFSTELLLGTKGTVEASIPQTAKLAIEAEIKEKFASEKMQVYESNQAARFTVLAYSNQIVTIKLMETLREGEVSFTQDGRTLSTGYSYRINLVGAGVDSKSLPCPSSTDDGLSSTPTSAPTSIPLPSPAPTLVSCGDGFEASIWTPVSTNPNVLPNSIGPCWQLSGFGLLNSNGTISILENNGSSMASWYGITRPIPANSRIQLDVRLDKLVGGQIWIGFTDSPDNIHNGKFLLIKPADPIRTGYLSAFSIIERKDDTPYSMFDNVFVPFDRGYYSINVQIDANRLSMWLNKSPARAFPIFEVTQRYLFIGYLSTTRTDIDARISNIQIQP